jgi:hypothetical protein
MNHGGSETHVKTSDAVGVMAGQTVAFPDERRLGGISHAGGQTFDPNQQRSAAWPSTTTLLIDGLVEEHSDGGFDRFERVVEISAALLEILELVRTVVPTDSTMRFDVAEEREARLALETAFQQIEVLKE